MATLRSICAWQLVAACAAATLLHAQQPALDTARRDTLPTAVLIGHVVDSTGLGLTGAEITLLHSDRVHSITGDSGSFRITGLPAGTVVFNVRRIGFEAATFTAVLRPGKTHRATFLLSATALSLPTVAVSDTMTHTHWLDQFERRRSSSLCPGTAHRHGGTA